LGIFHLGLGWEQYCQEHEAESSISAFSEGRLTGHFRALTSALDVRSYAGLYLSFSTNGSFNNCIQHLTTSPRARKKMHAISKISGEHCANAVVAGCHAEEVSVSE
jgi:hypothetical protein